MSIFTSLLRLIPWAKKGVSPPRLVRTDQDAQLLGAMRQWATNRPTGNAAAALQELEGHRSAPRGRLKRVQ